MKMKLNDSACLKKPVKAVEKRFDGGGLYLLVKADGTRRWRLKYFLHGTEKSLTFGDYPAVSLADARDAREAARALIAKGIDPSQQRKEERRAAAALKPFREVAEEWFKMKMEDEGKAEATLKRGRVLLNCLTTGSLGDRAIGEIEAPELLDLLRKITAKGRLETAGRVRAIASRVFRYGIATSVCKRDPAADLIGALTSPKVTSRPAIIKRPQVGTLMRDIYDYDGGRGPLVRLGMQFLVLTWVRPGEQRQAEWSEFDIRKRMWAIPADKMKMRLPHEVPLSRQALALLAVLRPLTGHCHYVFSFNDKPMSDGTVNKALRSMGYDTKTEHCAHGFRAMASTLMNAERHKDGSPVWEPDAIELCLAHVDDSTPRGIYNRAKLMPERIRIMRHYADRLDALRQGGAQVVPLKRKRA